jgi:ArsR family transcriptional regulator, virulence genes transcriptional regulator
MNITALHAKAGAAAGFLKHLANPRRLMILCELLQGERSVGELEAVVGLGQSALSQHLAKLRSAGLVRTRRQSQTIRYSLADPGIGKVLAVLYDLYCRPRQRR